MASVARGTSLSPFRVSHSGALSSNLCVKSVTASCRHQQLPVVQFDRLENLQTKKKNWLSKWQKLEVQRWRHLSFQIVNLKSNWNFHQAKSIDIFRRLRLKLRSTWSAKTWWRSTSYYMLWLGSQSRLRSLI